MKKSIVDSTYIVYKKTSILPSTRIICAFSGGQDSVLLFSILLHLKKILNLEISILYCHHFWQAQNLYTIEEVWKLTSLFRIPFCFFFMEYELQNESEARIWRYKKFSRSAQYFQSSTITLGHSASDSIETALWHIARGTSPKGLVNYKSYSKFNFEHFARTPGNLRFWSDDQSQMSGLVEQVSVKKHSINKITTSLLWNRSLLLRSMNNLKKSIFLSNVTYSQVIKIPKNISLRRGKNNVSKKKFKWKRKKYFYSHIRSTFNSGSIVRPLDDFHRSDITLIVSQNVLPYITDRTNQNMTFTRNRIRSEILPILRYFVNKQIDFHFYTYLQSNKIQQTFLEAIIRTLIESYCNTPNSIEGLFHLPYALQSQCIHEMVKIFIGRQVSILQIKNLRSKID